MSIVILYTAILSPFLNANHFPKAKLCQCQMFNKIKYSVYSSHFYNFLLHLLLPHHSERFAPCSDWKVKWFLLFYYPKTWVCICYVKKYQYLVSMNRYNIVTQYHDTTLYWFFPSEVVDALLKTDLCKIQFYNIKETWRKRAENKETLSGIYYVLHSTRSKHMEHYS